MIKLKVRSIDFNYDNNNNGVVDGASVRFDTHNVEGDIITLNGSVKISLAEYSENATDFEKLAVLVLAKIKDKINA